MVVGKSRTRAPVALKTALATAPPAPQTPSSPTPFTPSGLALSSTSSRSTVSNAAVMSAWTGTVQAHQQLKQELGLGHFEGRSWTGLHRHALMVASPLPGCSTSASPGNTRRDQGKMPAQLPGPPPSPSLPAVRRTIMARLFTDLVTPIQYPHCRRTLRPLPDFRLPGSARRRAANPRAAYPSLWGSRALEHQWR